ncbi:MAG TPA: protein-disulfide reductase DsbD domain-containing protein [Acetobacteraceae bacterium]|nr:protein-disulfide reductase DsbD domain-containing protein [Acetobacteraceae bacterium]
MVRYLLVFGLLTALFGAAPARALESTPVITPQMRASLVSDSDHAAPGATQRLGLLLRIAPGWHVYWKNPGEAGAPPELRLSLPPGFRPGAIEWPAPARLREGPLLVYAYSGEVLLSVPVTVPADADGLHARAEANWLVCKDICIPQEGRFRLDLPAGSAAPSAEAPLFAAAERAVPRAVPWQATIAPDGTLAVLGSELGPTTIRAASFVPDSEGAIVDAAPQPLRAVPGGLALALKRGKQFSAGRPLSGVLLLTDRAGLPSAVALRAEPGPVPPMFAAPDTPLWRLWALAFAGGVLLNLMPCVFPVLAMKALALAATRERRGGHAVAYGSGVLTSFAALGGALMLAREGLASAAGWGFQFASPGFVAATAWVMLAIGLNLSGMFRVGAGRFAGAGQGLGARGGAVGSFVTGVLAVLVATPCSAPFMAIAVAGALAAPPAAGLSVFLAMGAGLAAPYLALAVVPGLARLLPRPGRWMEWFRRVLALPMYATAAWLLWVLDQEAGRSGLFLALGGMALVALAAFVLGATQDATPGRRRAGVLGATGLAVAAFALLPALAAGPADAGEARLFLPGAEPFSAARLAALRAQQRPVFVDVTASWCLTCLVNERVALESAAVQSAFRDHGVAVLVGDWTRQDPALGAFLRAQGREGVPLYLLYRPGERSPHVLDQILTPASVLASLR